VVSIGISIASVFIGFSLSSCGVQHMFIMNDLKIYKESQDPEFCFDLLTKIYAFNDECEQTIEILDCG